MLKPRLLLFSLIAALPLSAAGCLGDHGASTLAPQLDDTLGDERPAPAVAVPVTATTPLPVPEPPPSPPSEASVELDGDALLLPPELLEGTFLFGVGVDPDSLFANLGATGAGYAPARVALELTDGALVIRALGDDLAPVAGSAGVLEAHPYEALDDGRLRVDFGASSAPLTVPVWSSCVYRQTDYALADAPRFEDGLLTWPVQATYERSGCPGYIPRRVDGLEVRYLRRADASAGFTPRPIDPDADFGYFVEAGAPGADAPVLARLPGIHPGAPDGSVVYYLSASFPETYAPAAEAAIEAWNDVFEDTIGARPLAVARATDDMIPWDPRHHFVIWDDSQGAGAYAPFAADAQTGEIVQAYIVMWFGELEALIDRYQGFFDAHPEVADDLWPEAPAAFASHARPAAFDRLPRALREALPRAEAFRRANFRPLSDALVRRTMATVGRGLGPDEVAELIVQDFLVHEVGHHLGLRHNFVGSVDREFIGDSGSASSVMDYVIGQPDPGAYDVDAMRYGYGDGAQASGYRYCSDEGVEIDPGCAQWDWGHPVTWFLGVLDELAATYPPGTPTATLTAAAEQGQWSDIFRRVRQFANTDYEAWDPAVDVSVFDDLLARVVCEGDCGQHLWLRQQLALYLLYSRHAVDHWWEADAPTVWYDFPSLTDTQAAILMDTYFALVTDPGQPLALKTTIVDKLPSANVAGAGALLEALRAHFEGLDTLTSDDEAVLQRVLAALD